MNKSVSLTEKAYESIKEQIMMQTLLPGAPVSEAELSQKLGMSRTPLRDAIKRLEAEGLVEVLPRKGTFIKHLTSRELMMYYEVSEGLEGMLAFNVACGIKSGLITKQQLRPLKKCIEAMDNFYESGNPKQWVHSDETFHELLYSLCDNSVLVESLGKIRIQFNCVSWFITPKYVDRNLSNQEHKELLAFLEAGDAENARATAQRQRARIREEIRNYCV